MAEHRINLKLPATELGRRDVVFEVFIDRGKQGELHVSEGGIDWWPKGAKANKRVKTWSQLRDFMET